MGCTEAVAGAQRVRGIAARTGAAGAACAAALLLSMTARAQAVPGAPAPAPAPAPTPVLTLVPCMLEHPLRFAALPAECGVLEVPEDPGSPAGRRIGLHVARVPAVSRRKAADPLFLVAGGPGEAAGALYPSLAAAFARIQRDRDIVLVDQRGTGASNPLACPQGPDAAGDAAADGSGTAAGTGVAAAARACLESLKSRADPAWYTSSVAVTDLERVRAALGAARIDLYAVSYGTRVAQQYLRRFPARVRSIILDGVVPPTRVLGPEGPLTAERALEGVLARCAASAACRGRFGDPRADYRAVRAAVAARAVPVTLADPASAEGAHLELTSGRLAAALRLLTYNADYASLLPLLLHAAARGDYAPLAAQFLLIGKAYGETVAVGMHNSVVCTEDVPFFPVPLPDLAQLQATYTGTSQLDGLHALCTVWPRGPMDADLHAPLASDVPVLLLSGSDDPVTPPAWAAEAARGLTKAVRLELEGFGHVQAGAPCVDRVMAAFLDRGTLDPDAARCARAARPLPFFISPNGPAP